MPPKPRREMPYTFLTARDIERLLTPRTRKGDMTGKEWSESTSSSPQFKKGWRENRKEVEQAIKLLRQLQKKMGANQLDDIKEMIRNIEGKSKQEFTQMLATGEAPTQAQGSQITEAERVEQLLDRIADITEQDLDIEEEEGELRPLKDELRALGYSERRGKWTKVIPTQQTQQQEDIRRAFEEEEGEPELEGELLPWERRGFVPEPEEEAQPREQILSSRVMPIPFKVWEMLVKQTIPLNIGDARSMSSRVIALSLFKNLKWSGNRPTVSLPQALNETIKQLPPELKTFARDNERNILIHGQRLINQLSEQMESFGQVEERQKVEELPEEEEMRQAFDEDEDEPLTIELTPDGAPLAEAFEEEDPTWVPWEPAVKKKRISALREEEEEEEEEPLRVGQTRIPRLEDYDRLFGEEDIETIPDAAPYQDVTMPERIDPASAVVADPRQELRRETGVTLPMQAGEVPRLEDFIKLTGTPMTVDLQSFLNAIMNRKEQETSIFDDKDPEDKMLATIIYTKFTPRPSRKQIKKVVSLEELANLQPYMSHVYAKSYKTLPNFISDAVVSREGFAMIADFLRAPETTNALRIDSIWGNSGGDFFTI